jgi:hypothetical protein
VYAPRYIHQSACDSTSPFFSVQTLRLSASDQFNLQIADSGSTNAVSFPSAYTKSGAIRWKE